MRGWKPLRINASRLFFALILSGVLTGCNSNGPSAEYLHMIVQQAVNNPARPEADQALDDKRKPSEVLIFLAIEPDMDVLDVFGGGGYYAEIISYLVGPAGSVTLYNNNPWDNFVGDQVRHRLSDNRLPNVEALTVEPAELSKLTRQYDAAIFILGMHDIYYEDKANGWPLIDVDSFLENLHRLVAPGGTLGVIDHNAAPGSDPAIVGKALHRIDPERIIKDLESVGFKLEDRSDVLRNPDDDLTGLVFNPELRWQSDRSVLRFRRES